MKSKRGWIAARHRRIDRAKSVGSLKKRGKRNSDNDGPEEKAELKSRRRSQGSDPRPDTERSKKQRKINSDGKIEDDMCRE